MNTIADDLRFAVRSLVKRPALFAIATISLALGISANTVIFAAIDGFMLRPLPYPNADRLVLVWTTNRERGWTRASTSVPDYLDWRKDAKTIELAAYNGVSFNLSDGDRPERVPGARVAPSFFSVMGTPPLYGRTFTPDEEQPGAGKVIVLGNAFWKRRFAADPRIVGGTVKLNGEAYTVIGVMPPKFRYPNIDTDVWTPLTRDGTEKRENRGLNVVGRIAPGATQASASKDLEGIAARLAGQYDEDRGNSNRIIGLQSALLGEGFSRGAIISTIAVVFVLLIACANVANLLLARATARSRELALRTAIGASRGRLIQQLLTESLVLALCGGVLGAVLSIWGVRATATLFPANIPGAENVTLNGRVLLYTLGISVLAGIVFGVAPAFSATRTSISNVLREGGRSASTGLHRNRLGASLVVAEIALALVLLISAGLLIKSAIVIQTLDMGFDQKNLLTMRLVLPANQYADTARVIAFQQQLATRLAALPGVKSVGATTDLPSQGGSSTTYYIDGRPAPAKGKEPFAAVRTITPGYLETMGYRLVRGRSVTEADKFGGPWVALVNESFAKRNWPTESAIGKRVIVETLSGPTTREVVGIVADVREYGADSDVPSTMYFSAYQRPQRGLAVVMRTGVDPATLAPQARAALAELDATIPAFAVQTMQEILELDQQGNMIMPRLLTAFGAIALLLAVVGVYGVMSYSVTQRTQEVGIRMALGAQTGDILRLVLAQGGTLAALGLAIGLALAAAATKGLSFFLVGVSASDPVVFVGVSATLAFAALVATFIPARRAVRVDPLVALRAES